MKIQSILLLILFAAAALSAAVSAITYRCEPGNALRRIVTVVVSFWSLLTLSAGLAFVSKVGPIVAGEGFLLAFAPAAALLCGGAAGSRKRSGQSVQALVLVGTILVLSDLGVFYSLNHRVVELVQTLGLDAKHETYQPEANKDCPENLKSLYFAFDKYVEGNGTLPAADKWMDNEELASKVQKDEWLHCPEVSNRHDDKFGYAYNEAVAGVSLNGKKLSEMPNAARIPLLYDSSVITKSAHDKFSSLPKAGRHKGRNNVLFCDGHVEAVPVARQ